MLDGNGPVLSGGFGADVTDINESPWWWGRDEIHRVPVEIPLPSTALPGKQECSVHRECGASIY